MGNGEGWVALEAGVRERVAGWYIGRKERREGKREKRGWILNVDAYHNTLRHAADRCQLKRDSFPR